MDERRKDIRVRARIPCSLMVSATGKRFPGNTRNISFGGAEFEASESLTRAGQAVVVGTPVIVSFMPRRGGNYLELKMPCRVRFVAANYAGLEFTATMPTPEERAALRTMLETRSNRFD
ncbi:MAG: PilZ domain-containing protein [Dechloromonas sp.]|nr:MAG: PilZ domain-containing protein [Dechloromonas sp.]